MKITEHKYNGMQYTKAHSSRNNNANCRMNRLEREWEFIRAPEDRPNAEIFQAARYKRNKEKTPIERNKKMKSENLFFIKKKRKIFLLFLRDFFSSPPISGFGCFFVAGEFLRSAYIFFFCLCAPYNFFAVCCHRLCRSRDI